MTEGLFERYFRLLAGQLPAREYGVIAEVDVEMADAVPVEPAVCLC